MNAILGGQFASRINLNLREDKGYSYGANSSFSFRRGPGPFEAGGTVQTAVTKESLVEIFKELTDITGRRPVTDAELAFAKERIIQGFPSRFETTFGVAGQIAILVDRRAARRRVRPLSGAGRSRHQGRRRPRRPGVHHAGNDDDPGRGRPVADRGAAQEPAVRRKHPAARHRG